jgi:1,4-alpha-glucan branching enzyme
MPTKKAAQPTTMKVTFTLPKEVEGKTVTLCGEFNEWSPDSIPLKRGRDRAWKATVVLDRGRSYRYRYLIDGERWENAWQADAYVPNPFGGEDSIIVVD